MRGLALCPTLLAQTNGAIEPVDRVIAVVNTEVITERELAARIAQVSQRAQKQGARLPPPDDLQRRVLEQIILDRAVLQAAKDRGITVNEVQIDRAIESIAQDNRSAFGNYAISYALKGWHLPLFAKRFGANHRGSSARVRS